MAKADPKSNAVTNVDSNATALALNDEYAEYAGVGFENHTSDDYSIPFLTILQALSPQVAGDPEKFRQGMILNTVTGELVSAQQGVGFVPAMTQHLYVEWKPRQQGGGFVGIHEPASPEVAAAKNESKEFGVYKTPSGNDLIETFYVYGIVVLDDGSASEATLAFSSTKIKPYKGWMTKAKGIQIGLPDGRRIPAPLMAHRYRLKSISEKNAKGQFYNWAIEFDGPDAMSCRLRPADPVFQAAVKIKGLIEEGKARAAFETQAPGSGNEEANGGAAPSKPVF